MLHNAYSFFIVLFTLCSLSAGAQVSALQFYNAGIGFYNNQEFQKADSLFTISLSKESSRDAYFNRALCRGKMANKKGYCIDMANACYLGEEKAAKLFVKGCGKMDTIFTVVEPKVSSITIYSSEVIYKYGDSIILKQFTKYSKQARDPNFVPQPIDTSKKETSSQVEERVEFPGGVKALMDFIVKNRKIPKNYDNNGKVFLKFVVNEDGSLSNIQVLKGILYYPECDEEATRLVAIMPYWKPAKLNGRPVKCYFNLPISFKR
jgi:TonB family protein